jgi:multiple sugar transport system ATP-binding protein
VRKTTVLRAIAGLEEITHGDVLVDDAPITYATPGDRDVAMVFQSNVLYPYLTVRQNIGFALEIAKVSRAAVRRAVDEVAALLHLTEVLDRMPAQLSGGQQQRTAIGRAIIRRPRLLLMDEPLSSLDAHLRVEMRSQIVRLQRRLGVTTLYVTHDQLEAMSMGDRVALMRDGQIVQLGTPTDLYNNPADLFVAQFIGSPPMNVVRASVVNVDGMPAVRIGDRTIELDELAHARLPGLSELVGRDVALGVRPEALRHDAKGELVVSAIETEQHGSDRVVYATIHAHRVSETNGTTTTESDPTTTIAITIDTADQVDRFRPFGLKVDPLDPSDDLATGTALARSPAG